MKFIPAIIIMIIIFLFSHAPGSTSAQSSGMVTDLVMTTIDKVFGDSDYIMVFLNYMIGMAEFLVRKFAHITEYAALSFACCYAYDNEKRKKFWLVVILFSFFYAMTDEFHQLFIDGRSGQFSDVMIDMIGVFIGVSIYLTRDFAKWLCQQGMHIGTTLYVFIISAVYPLYQGEKYSFLKIFSIPIFCILVGLWVVFIFTRRWRENKISISQITITDGLVVGHAMTILGLYACSYFGIMFVEYRFPFKELMLQLLLTLIYLFVSRFMIGNSRLGIFLILAIVVPHFLLIYDLYKSVPTMWYDSYKAILFSDVFISEDIMKYGIIGCLIYVSIFLSQGISCGKKYKDIICVGVGLCMITYIIYYFMQGQHMVITPFAFLIMGIGERRIRWLQIQSQR